MNRLVNSFVESTVQCWGCEVFDRLFQIVSNAAAAVYDKFVIFCAILFCVLFAFYLINAVWKNFKGGITDPLYQKSLKPLFINSLVSLTFLSMWGCVAALYHNHHIRTGRKYNGYLYTKHAANKPR